MTVATALLMVLLPQIVGNLVDAYGTLDCGPCLPVQGLLLLLSIPSMMLHAAKFGGVVPGDVSNGAFAAYGACLALVGSYSAYRVSRSGCTVMLL